MVKVFRACVQQILVCAPKPDNIIVIEIRGSDKDRTVLSGNQATAGPFFLLPYSPDRNPIE